MYKHKNIKININIYTLMMFFLLIMSILGIKNELIDFRVYEYISNKKEVGYVFENYLIETHNVTIEDTSKTNNLILLYLESMESSFSGLEKTGGESLGTNLIPNLTSLALKNVNFSNNDELGGFNNFNSTSWTMGGLFASQSGMPWFFPTSNHMNNNTEFAPNVKTLCDILKDNGYTCEYICGCDSSFAGKESYLKTHGFDTVYDVFDMLDDGYIDERNDYWGADDHDVYRFAKDKLIELSKQSGKFCFSMLTTDTHGPGGYQCEQCSNEYENPYMNSIKCADNQVYEFITWISQQDFYNDTTIVVLGDHQTMDGILSENSNYNNRFVYNCFINSKILPVKEKNRQFNTTDLFPTILASVGFEIEGDKLGFGTNLFSDKETLQETLGYDYLNKEFSKRSIYAEEHYY